MAADPTLVCKFNRTGFCKFQENCRNLHINEICVENECNLKSCSKRHPRKCKYFSIFGQCKFGSRCAYLHIQSSSCLELKALKEEIEKQKAKVRELEDKLATEGPPSHSEYTPLSSQNNVSNANQTIEHSPSTLSLSPIPQVDGFDDSKEDAFIDLSFMTEVLGDCDDCGFCDCYEDILTLDEYLKHLKKFGNICFNCCDFFLERPWFGLVHPQYIPDDQE